MGLTARLVTSLITLQRILDSTMHGIGKRATLLKCSFEELGPLTGRGGRLPILSRSISFEILMYTFCVPMCKWVDLHHDSKGRELRRFSKGEEQ